ncbi:MAG: hypothetical protein K2N73_11000 [Lachnospiraceae bacterium]|nr:hypothetical protein [Lachnospiraceae bacterium]
MQHKKIYTVSGTKLSMAYFEGFVQNGSALYTAENAVGGKHFVILNRFCSYEQETKWGRFSCKSKLTPNSTLKIYAFSCDAQPQQAEELNRYFHNGDVPWSKKLAHFTQDGESFVGHEDILLYNLTGEYLWIAVEIERGINKDVVGCMLYDMRLDTQGDNFLWTFPEIYQEEGGFFHRYLSIFSSIYQDMSDQIANLDRLLDIDKTPFPFLLELAEWLGFASEGDFPDEEMLRRLVKELYYLNRIKGTKEVIRRLTDIVLGGEALNNLLIIERNRLEGYIPDNVRMTYQKLYGSSMHEVTILVKHVADKRRHSQLMYLIKQFKPARSNIRLVFSQQCSNLDSYCFLDFNAALFRKGYAHMDKDSRMGGKTFLA